MSFSSNAEITNGEPSNHVGVMMNESGTHDRPMYRLVEKIKTCRTATTKNASKQVVTLFSHNPKIRFDQLRNTIEHLVKEFAIIITNGTSGINRVSSYTNENSCSAEQFLQDLKTYSKTNMDQYLKIVRPGYWHENVLSEVYVLSKQQHKDFCSHLSSYLLRCENERIFFDIVKELSEIDEEVKFYKEKVSVEISRVRVHAGME